MPALNSLPILYGSVGGTAIAGSCNSASWSLVYVTLGAAYARAAPPGYPIPPYPGQVSRGLTECHQTIPSGTRLQLFSDEAAALVAAGAAAYS